MQTKAAEAPAAAVLPVRVVTARLGRSRPAAPWARLAVLGGPFVEGPGGSDASAALLVQAGTAPL